jgi:hypothetical protein
MNPADPATRRPDFVPEGEVPTSERTLLFSSHEGARMQELSLDEDSALAHIGEVAVPSPSPTLTHPDIDPFFCPPSKGFCSLLRKAYIDDPPVPGPGDDLKLIEGLWWTRG